MQWFKHYTASHEDPDISDSWDEFGDAGPLLFWVILEVYGQEFSHLENDYLCLSLRYFERKTRRKFKKSEKILEFFQNRSRIFFKIDGHNILLKCPKFIEIASNWTRRENIIPTEVPTEVPTAKEVEVEKKKKRIYSQTSVEVRLSELLFSKIHERNNGHKEPDIQSWAKDVDLMIRIDRRMPEEIERLIEWSQSDDFWRNNILSMSKLRKQFDQLVLKSKSKKAEFWDKVL